VSGIGFRDAFSLAILDVALLAIFVQIALQIRGFTARFVQVLTALTGTGTLLGMLGMPLVAMLPETGEVESIGELPALLWLGLLLWSLVVLGHILRHALSTSLVVGLIMGLTYTVFSISLIQLLFPGIS